MKTWLTSYGDARFRASLERLMASARGHGIDECRSWSRDALERTSLYRTHRATLDEWPGGGFWLWKPFIVKETLREMAPGDILVYSDAGIEITKSLQPLFEIGPARTNPM